MHMYVCTIHEMGSAKRIKVQVYNIHVGANSGQLYIHTCTYMYIHAYIEHHSAYEKERKKEDVHKHTRAHHNTIPPPHPTHTHTQQLKNYM